MKERIMRIGLDSDGDLSVVARDEAVAITEGRMFYWPDSSLEDYVTLDETTSALVLEAVTELVKSLLDKQNKV